MICVEVVVSEFKARMRPDLVSVDCRHMARCLPVTITYTPTGIGAEPFCEHVLHKLITYIAYNMHCCQ